MPSQWTCPARGHVLSSTVPLPNGAHVSSATARQKRAQNAALSIHCAERAISKGAHAGRTRWHVKRRVRACVTDCLSWKLDASSISSFSSSARHACTRSHTPVTQVWCEASGVSDPLLNDGWRCAACSEQCTKYNTTSCHISGCVAIGGSFFCCSASIACDGWCHTWQPVARSGASHTWVSFSRLLRRQSCTRPPPPRTSAQYEFTSARHASARMTSLP
jgi:hypothetical protein